MGRKYYTDIFKKYYDKCTERAKDELGADAPQNSIMETAAEIFNETSNAEQIAGYYIAYHEEDALKDWKINTEGKVLSGLDMEVGKILESLYVQPEEHSSRTA